MKATRRLITLIKEMLDALARVIHTVHYLEWFRLAFILIGFIATIYLITLI